ncbi:hypothetical protein BCR34DRAFT_556204 [Clohesyomyces aquaticus]|uniref:Uncharacterized protein n=1 Tax=Clohesyomyces aquaticus TaxID=1231657 RepID=A0A1Y2A342_9PLEO|nr:hypothetical protein BCR34DRAFT_556204 [Clohesyomyces aquaticus]
MGPPSAEHSAPSLQRGQRNDVPSEEPRFMNPASARNGSTSANSQPRVQRNDNIPSSQINTQNVDAAEGLLLLGSPDRLQRTNTMSNGHRGPRPEEEVRMATPRPSGTHDRLQERVDDVTPPRPNLKRKADSPLSNGAKRQYFKIWDGDREINAELNEIDLRLDYELKPQMELLQARQELVNAAWIDRTGELNSMNREDRELRKAQLEKLTQTFVEEVALINELQALHAHVRPGLDAKIG